jgi:phosphoribosylaminoimidazole-succinocarboxamide synthase
MLGLATDDLLRSVESIARRVNDLLVPHLLEKGILLVDMKLEFGTDSNGVVFLGDEISGDTCRFWDSNTKETMDKDRFRQDLGQVEEFYQEVFRRVTGHD